MVVRAVDAAVSLETVIGRMTVVIRDKTQRVMVMAAAVDAVTAVDAEKAVTALRA